jgi:hypothetical protein
MKIFLTTVQDSDYLHKENIARIQQFLSRKHTVIALDKIAKDVKQDNLDLYQSIYRNIKDANLFIAEISKFNTALGHQIIQAIELKKFVTLLYSGKEPDILKNNSTLSTDKIQVIAVV